MAKKLRWIARALCGVLALACVAFIVATWSGHSPFETNAGAVPLSLLATAFAILFAYVAFTGRSPLR